MGCGASSARLSTATPVTSPNRKPGGRSLDRTLASEAAELLAATKATLTADVMNGEVLKVVGRVQPTTLLRAPLSGRACVYYEVRVEDDLVVEATDFFLRTDQCGLASSVLVDARHSGALACAFRADRTETFDLRDIMPPEQAFEDEERKSEVPRVEASESVVLAGDALAAFGFLDNATLTPATVVSRDATARLQWTSHQKRSWSALRDRPIFITTSYVVINHPDFSKSLDQHDDDDEDDEDDEEKTGSDLSADDDDDDDDEEEDDVEEDDERVARSWFFSTFERKQGDEFAASSS